MENEKKSYIRKGNICLICSGNGQWKYKAFILNIIYQFSEILTKSSINIKRIWIYNIDILKAKCWKDNKSDRIIKPQ